MQAELQKGGGEAGEWKSGKPSRRKMQLCQWCVFLTVEKSLTPDQGLRWLAHTDGHSFGRPNECLFCNLRYKSSGEVTCLVATHKPDRARRCGQCHQHSSSGKPQSPLPTFVVSAIRP